MIHFIYDGSFEGLLQCVLESQRRTCVPDGIHVGVACYQPGLFDETLSIKVDESACTNLKNTLWKILGSARRHTLMRAALRDEVAMERDLLLYILLVLNNPAQASNNTLKEVRAIEESAHRVSHEAHKYKGFVRFEKLADSRFYAKIEPHNNVLPLLSRHFSERFATQTWIIHDLRRQLVLIHDLKNTRLLPVHAHDVPEHHEEESDFQAMWKTFFDSAAIRERLNPSCQQNFVPFRYREFLSEFA